MTTSLTIAGHNPPVPPAAGRRRSTGQPGTAAAGPDS